MIRLWRGLRKQYRRGKLRAGLSPYPAPSAYLNVSAISVYQKHYCLNIILEALLLAKRVVDSHVDAALLVYLDACVHTTTTYADAFNAVDFRIVDGDLPAIAVDNVDNSLAVALELLYRSAGNRKAGETF